MGQTTSLPEGSPSRAPPNTMLPTTFDNDPPRPPLNTMLRTTFEKDKYKTLFFDLELEPFEDQTASDPTLIQALHHRWDTYDGSERIEIGRAIEAFHEAVKAKTDAQRQATYSETYRGAVDDDGEGWRPRFGYFEERQRLLLAALKHVEMRCQHVLVLTGRAVRDDEVARMMKDVMARVAKEGEGLGRWMRENLERLRKEAGEKVAGWEVQRAAAKSGRDGEGGDVKMRGVTEMSVTRDKGLRLEREAASREIVWDRVWHGRLLLGAGSFGRANLWIQVDKTIGAICNRVVHKEASLDEMWKSERYWTNGAPGSKNNFSNTLPIEIQAHLDMRGKPGSRSVVELLNYNMRFQEQQADLYLEFCPFGDSFNLLEDNDYRYYCETHGKRMEFRWRDCSDQSSFIPESFCWSAFLSMVTAGLLMQRGQLSRVEADHNWSVIVHRDLKLENVFLGSPNTEAFTGYPQVKIADFGLAIKVPPGDTRPLQELAIDGTHDHAAPEMHVKLEVDKVFRRQSTKTNVWGVGMVIHSLMSGQYGPCDQAEDWFNWSDAERREPPEFDASAQEYFSTELINLVMACMRYDDRDRPTFDHLLAEIRRYTTSGRGDLAVGLRDLSVGDPRYADKYAANALRHRKDKYALGMAYEKTGFNQHRTYVRTSPSIALAAL